MLDTTEAETASSSEEEDQSVILTPTSATSVCDDGVSEICGHRSLVWSPRLIHESISMNKWMSKIDSESYLSELSIPGSHESCARISVPWVQCQHLSIVEQLEAGIRYLDFRLGVYFGKLYLYHGRSPLGLALTDVLGKIYAWLDLSPSEAIMLQIKMEGGSGDETAFESLLREEIASHMKYWALETTIPRLGTVRGKIQLMRRFPTSTTAIGIDVRQWADNSPRFTIPMSGHEKLIVQDLYEFTDVVSSFLELIRAKSNAINALIKGAKEDQKCRSWYLCWCNAYALPLSFGIIARPSDVAIGRNEGQQFVPGVNSALLRTFFSAPIKGRFGTILLDYMETPALDLVSSIVRSNTFV